jgi:hypothetical protein
MHPGRFEQCKYYTALRKWRNSAKADLVHHGLHLQLEYCEYGRQRLFPDAY